jgi:hypothetical protein
MTASCILSQFHIDSPPFLVAAVVAAREPLNRDNLNDFPSTATLVAEAGHSLGIPHSPLIGMPADQFIED